MYKKKSLLVISDSEHASSQRTARYFTREIGKSVGVYDEFTYQLIGSISKTDLIMTLQNFIKDSLRVIYQQTQFLLYVYFDINTDILDDQVMNIFERMIHELNPISRVRKNTCIIFITEKNSISKFLTSNNNLNYDWVVISTQNSYTDATDSTNMMIMSLVLIFVKYAHILYEITLFELQDFLLQEMYSTWVTNLNIPVITVSNFDLFMSFLF